MMKRIYEEVLEEHFSLHDEMAFLAGPRQVGKTTTAQSLKTTHPLFYYNNWDNEDDRALILKGPRAIMEAYPIEQLEAIKPFLTFDEIHKYGGWKNFIKGFYDTYGKLLHILVTGSSRLDVYRVGGDSLMGRYFPYRVHPLSVAECLRTKIPVKEIQEPQEISEDVFQALLRFGGFPKPFLNQEMRFLRRWQSLRKEQLFREDIRDFGSVHEVAKLEILAKYLGETVGQLTNFTALANKVKVAVTTITRWLDVLTTFYFCFSVRPYSKNIVRSLIKEPKFYLWDWSNIQDEGQRLENIVASHLLKAIHFWTDLGLGNYGLYFLRDKEQREVDFLVTKDDQPWFLVEVKRSGKQGISRAMHHFYKATGAKHAFLIAFDRPYVDRDCFQINTPVIVPAKTFLSQLI